jgi:hypothetical protein
MRTSSAIAACVGCAFILLAPSSAPAQPVIAESIEWVLTTSARVVVGKVIKVGVVIDRDKNECQVVTIAISKTLKGAAADRETVLVPQYIYRGFAKQWMDEGIPIVFCLNKHDGKRISIPTDKFAWVLRDDHNSVDAILLGESKNYFTGCIPVLTRDFKVLTKTDAIIKYLEKTIAALPKNATPRSVEVEVPDNTPVFEKLWSKSAVYLVIPGDDKPIINTNR